jgi:photosystem II stability/assembly factor-like uncharacterized protein
VDFSTPLDATMVSSQQGEIFKTLDGGVTWQSTKDGKPLSLANLLPQATTLSGWFGETFGWAATASGNCSGEKFSSAFTCSVESGLWQTQDSGQTWQAINLPGQIANRP